MATSLTQYGITLTFDTDYTVGTYNNGDYYILENTPGGGVTITYIDPPSVLIPSRSDVTNDPPTTVLNTYGNGAMINPFASQGKQGFDSGSVSYDASKNVARPGGNDLSGSNTLVVPAGSSLICSDSRTNVDRPILQNGAVFTILAAAPAANSFRPGYCGTDKSHPWTTASLVEANVPSLTSVAGEPGLATTETDFERPWFEMIPSSTPGRYIHPANNQPDYGGDIHDRTGTAALRLAMDDSFAAKQTALIRFVQYGIDVYSACVTGGEWENNGSHNVGRKIALLVAGKALNSSAILAYCNAANHFIFADDQQTFICDTAQLSVIPKTDDERERLPYVEFPVTVSGAVFTKVAHGLQLYQPARFSTTGTLPPELELDTDYKILSTNLTADTFSVARTGSSPITCSNGGTGTLTFTMVGVPDWGEKHSTQRTRDGSNWGAYYRNIIYNPGMRSVLAAYLWGGRSDWNWEPYFLYYERIRNITVGNDKWGAWTNNVWWEYGYGDVPTGPPTAPTAVSATAIGPGAIDVVVTDNSTDATTINVTRANTSGGTYSTIAVIGPGSQTYRDSTPLPARTYYYKFQAVNSQGTTTSATYVSATTPAASPSTSLPGWTGSAPGITA